MPYGIDYYFTVRASFWACCAAPPPPKPKKEKKAKKEKEKKEKKPKKEKKTKTDNKSDDRHCLPDGFQCNGGEEVSPVAVRGDHGASEGDDVDQRPRHGQPQNNLLCSVYTVGSFVLCKCALSPSHFTSLVTIGSEMWHRYTKVYVCKH